MKLIHFSATPVTEVYAKDPDSRYRRDKPAGLWVSDEDAEDSWSTWCRSEEFRLDGLKIAHAVTLADDARILYLRGAADIDEFTRRYAIESDPIAWKIYGIDWAAVGREYQGIVITPYVWSRRLDGPGWYYGWDCASGCIWDPAAIASITVVESERAS